MISIISIIFGIAISCFALYINYTWYKYCNKINDDWAEKYIELNEEWSKKYKKLNHTWAEKEVRRDD